MSRAGKSSKAAACCTTTMDRISKLPDELLYSIISRLKLREIVKLSVLSNRFKHICSSIPHLQFNWHNMFQTDSWQIRENSACPLYKEKFIRGVNQFLQFYEGKQISSFKLSCCLGSECSNDIDQWLRFALSRGAEKLRFSLCCEGYCYRYDRYVNDVESEGNYVLGKELFEGVKSNLKELCLHACLLKPNFTYQFSGLEALDLIELPLSLYDLHGLFPCLVNLKRLEFRWCTLPSKLSLGALTRLQEFAVVRSDGLEVLDLSNGNLLNFTWRSLGCITFDLRGAPNLIELQCFANEWTFQYLFTRLPQHSPCLRELMVLSPSNWVESLPKSISIFSQVTKLVLHLSNSPKFSIFKLISILDAFPCLCTLHLMTSCREDVDEEKLKPGVFVPKNLTKVVMFIFHNTPLLMEFTIYLLKNAPVLRMLKLFIRQVSPNEGECEMGYERLKEFAKDGVLVVNDK